MEMNQHTNRYFYKISKKIREIEKNQPISCPYIIEGQNNTETEVNYNGKYQPLQLYRCAAADDHRNPTVQQFILAAAVLCAAERTGGETSRIFGTATQHPSGAAIQEIHSYNSDGQFSGTGLGLLRLVCMAIFPDSPSRWNTP